MKNAEIEITGSDYQINVNDPDTDRERMTMYDAGYCVFGPHVMVRTDLAAVVKLVEKAYLKGLSDGKRSGAFSAKAEIRTALGLS